MMSWPPSKEEIETYYDEWYDSLTEGDFDDLDVETAMHWAYLEGFMRAAEF